MNTVALVLDLALFLLVDTLGAPRFRTREAAQGTLQRLGPLAATALERGAASDSLERATRCRWLLTLEEHRRDKAAWERSGAILPPHWTRLPWLFLEESYEGPAVLQYLAPVQAKSGYGQWRTGYLDYRTATRGWLATHLRHGYSERGLLELMERMAHAEIAWTWHECKMWRLFPY